MEYFNYSYTLEEFKNGIVNLDSLEKEIRDSDILVALAFITLNGDVIISFKAELSDNDENILNEIVANHTGEALKESNIVDVNLITENKKTIEHGFELPNKFYMSESWTLDINASEGEQSFYISKPFPISLLNAKLQVTEEMVNDTMEAYVGDPMTVGIVAVDASEGATELYVNPESLAYLKIGRFVGINNQLFNRIIDVDLTTNKIKLQYPIDFDISAYTYIQLIIKIADNLFFNSVQSLDIGQAVPTGQRVPANMPIKIIYKNYSGKSKKVMLFIEYLY